MTRFPLPDQAPCFFCEIAAGRSQQWQIVEEAGLTLTLLNGRQFEVGQCVVVPRRHAATILDLTAAEGAAVMRAAQRLTEVFAAEYGPDGVLLYQNNGTGSGQEVPHFHLHVVPRRDGSDWGFGPPHIERLEREGRARLHDHLIETDEKHATVAALRAALVSKVGNGV